MSATTATTPAPTDDTVATRAAYRLATLLLLIAVGLALYEVGTTAAGLVRGREVTLQGIVNVRSTDLAMPAYVDQPRIAEATVHIRDASAKQQLLAFVRDMIPIVMFAAGLWLLRGVLQSVRRGDPFTERNVHRFRWIALVLMATPVTDIVQHYLDNKLASTVPNLTHWPNGGSFQLTGLAGGLVVLALAQVFAYGARLREDVEGTV
jgi:hypothetical protein